MYNGDSSINSSNHENLEDIVSLVEVFLLKRAGNNTLVLTGWNDNTYHSIYDKSNYSSNAKVNYITYSTGDIDGILSDIHILEYHCKHKILNTLYAFEAFDSDQHIPIILKHDKNFIQGNRKSLSNKILTIVVNNSNEECIETFFHNKMPYYSINDTNVLNTDQFVDFLSNELEHTSIDDMSFTEKILGVCNSIPKCSIL